MRVAARYLTAWAALLALTVACRALASESPERVYADEHGVIRWRSDHNEVALFGANYSLASACDYRAAGSVGADRKKLVEQDFTHFVRMGWGGVRLCFWGDWENSDAEGNLIRNDHLDVLDYEIAAAARHGLGILLTPITTYSSLWPDGKDGPSIRGFSKAYRKDVLGTDPNAIAAQCNYLRQLLNHVNPYTGVALKEEPAILFIETINEPTHHSADLAGSIAYIDALAAAIRSTGCQKLLFYNLSQDFAIAPAIKASSVPGMTFAWYPTGLGAGHALTANYLRTVDDYGPMTEPQLRDRPKIVYEFDSADVNSGYMYPAMVRAFREAGAQFMTMFSYDMLATAPYNLGWQTHFLNLVYAPRKAVSAVIGAEAARVLPRYSHWGDYPDNRRFGPFRVSYEEDLSELVTAEKFLYSNNTATAPPRPEKLRKIVGVGSSPVISYEGAGAYFLDRLAPGVWRLELYPDAIAVLDPFAQHLNNRTAAVRLVDHTWPMTVRLPDLGGEFSVEPLSDGNSWRSDAGGGRFEIRPGVYLLAKSGHARAPLPATIDGIGLKEFVCPVAPDLPAQLLPQVRDVNCAGMSSRFAVDVIDPKTPDAVTLHFRFAGETAFQAVPLRPAGGYRYAADVVPDDRQGMIDYFFTADIGGTTVRYPGADAEFLHTKVAPANEPVELFSAATDGRSLAYTRIGDDIRHGIFENRPAAGANPAALRLFLPLSRDATLDDYTASLVIKDRLQARAPVIGATSIVHIKARGSREGQRLHLTLVECDGTAWSVPLILGTDWRDFALPVGEFRIARGVMLPLGFPGRWNYWITPAKGRGGPGDRLHGERAEHLQFSLQPDHDAPPRAEDDWTDIAAVWLTPIGPAENGAIPAQSK